MQVQGGADGFAAKGPARKVRAVFGAIVPPGSAQPVWQPHRHAPGQGRFDTIGQTAQPHTPPA